MENIVGPSFQRVTGIQFVGRDGFGGAVGLAEAIRAGDIASDVFLAADGTQVMQLLLPPGSAWATWYVPFARAVRVLAYSPDSHWRADFERIARGDVRWDVVLRQPGLKFGRSDPDLDPGGYLTVLTCRLAELVYGEPGLAVGILGPDHNPEQIPPVDVLRRGLASGELDATMAYRNSVAGRTPFVELPPEVSLSDPAFEADYARTTYTTRGGQTFRGGLVYYTAAVLAGAQRPAAGAEFVAHLFSSEVQGELLRAGFELAPQQVYGSETEVPPRVRPRDAGRTARCH
ncbi:MAG: extracellular solute-binding protein [Chloroflexi bacterium]|nr:extracellular solute-binding protein [Chloroflexota bacterium]